MGVEMRKRLLALVNVIGHVVKKKVQLLELPTFASRVFKYKE